MQSVKFYQDYLSKKFGIPPEETEYVCDDSEYKTYSIYFRIPKYDVYCSWEENEDTGETSCYDDNWNHSTVKKELKKVIRESREYKDEYPKREKLAKKREKELEEKLDILQKKYTTLREKYVELKYRPENYGARKAQKHFEDIAKE
ncbi:hypothetical protein ISTM_4 [Insectomime virus]|uniref:Uncharacterized protein n=1 Tax=Tunisvirus fontaine2 TaxID=1421067 RepID=V9SFD3_9VIRU|nr:hypothetical protein D1R32_gp324 [Tunisvirus fontaine2]AHA45902.1 hypothetical protein ISTM_4 [Insectomime virus]AHC55041.1 hypothetical protein TNS_ORF323 [Tunisvirus fontaine2]